MVYGTGLVIWWFRALAPWPSILPLTGFVLGCPKFNSLAALCTHVQPTGLPPSRWGFLNQHGSFASNLSILALKRGQLSKLTYIRSGSREETE